jgi:hypothetical protein
MSDNLTRCPCCNSTIRVCPDGARLEIVSVSKPSAAEVWRPRPKSRRPRQLTAPSITSRNTTEREAIAVIARVASKQGYDLGELRSTSRAPDLVRIRWQAMAAARAETAASLPQIGRILNRDHSTVLHGLRRVEAAA